MNYKITILLLLTNFISAQIKGVVVDEKNQPIPYVNIWVENQNTGATSQEDGTFEIKTAPQNQILVFSSLGFETKKVAASEAKKVTLQSITFLLDEVLIAKPQNTTSIKIGNFKKAFYLPEPQTVPWIFAKKVMLYSANPELKYLNNITFYTHSEVAGAVFRVRIFSVNQKNMPGEDILTEDVIVNPKKGKEKTMVDVSKYKIEIPKEGVIIGFESLFMEQNAYIEMPNKLGVTSVNYDPHILYQYSDVEESYAYRSGIWIMQRFNPHPQKEEQKLVVAPAINITLTN